MKTKASSNDPYSNLPTQFTYPKRAPNKSARLVRLLSYAVLFSSAATLSLILPTPWSSFSWNNGTKVAPKSQEWQDNTWPIREQTAWDISTDFAHPRLLEYDVQEGTWLRLDVHPVSGDIVFDMVGDIYCLPGKEALQESHSNGPVKARPVLLGVPHDSDPHFSPSGDRLVFRSDAELGIENIWVVEWKGCEAMDVRSKDGSNSAALALQFFEEDLLAKGIKETSQRKSNRLLREGRLQARRVTNETYRWVSDARFHPSGDSVIATKWYTSERSLGAGEGWSYSVPSVAGIQEHQTQIRPGSGKRLISRSLPLGWTQEDYGEQQIGPEQLIWQGTDSIIYSKNVIDSSAFDYSKDVHSGIYAIFQHNLTTGATELLVSSFPGGASRPELSRDGRTLAFVRRVRDKEALVLKDLQTGSIRHVWHGLTYDLSTISAPMGTYPSFSFTPDDSAVIIWAAGQIYHIPLNTNALGERIGAAQSPKPIPFIAHVEKRVAETLTGDFNLVKLETQDTQREQSFIDLRVDDGGHRIVFQSAGTNYWKTVGKDDVHKLPVLDENAPYYSPSFVYGRENLIIHAQWSDSAYTSFELADIHINHAYKIEGLPLGRYISPVLCECIGPNRQIALIKTAGDIISGDILATAQPGLYIGDIRLPAEGNTRGIVKIRNIRFIPTEIDLYDRSNIRFLEENKKLLVQQSNRAFVIDLHERIDQSGKPHHTTLATGKMSTELVVTPRRNFWGQLDAGQVAFVDFFNVYFVLGNNLFGQGAWSRPANATKGLIRLSLDGGHDITWSRDGKKLFWFLGPYLHSLEVSKLRHCSSSIEKDHLTFGISCVKNLLEFQEIRIEHSTDIARLKKEAASLAGSAQVSANADVVVIFNATLLTMHTGNLEDDYIPSGVLTIRGGVIEHVGSLVGFQIPQGATVFDANGGFVIPGFIDVHAHWSSYPYPAKSWEMETFLAYGITTLHNPSAQNVGGFIERSRVEKGLMIGPRIFTVGDVIYGAAAASIHQDIADMDEAKSALTRIKVEGGPFSISYKNYNLPSRASRQRLLKYAQEIKMLCVPEGGMNYDWDLTYIIDGMTTIEHAIPIPNLYDDVLNLYAQSGTGSTPTHIVNYGGAWGEQLVWATEDIPNDPKLRRFTRHDILESLTESTARPPTSYALFNTSESVAKMVRKGLLTHIGAHGEPPLGVNYHAEMSFTAAGGLDNYEVLQAATSSGAKTLGLFSSIGSLAPGKLADFLVYPPGVDLLHDRIGKDTRDILLVSRGGRIWEAETMTEAWPITGRKQEMPVINAD